MYINKKNTNRFDTMSFIENSDIYNSALFKKYKDLDTSEFRKTYSLNKTDKRSDLLSDTILKNSKYESFLYLMDHSLDESSTTIEIDFDSVQDLLNRLGV